MCIIPELKYKISKKFFMIINDLTNLSLNNIGLFFLSASLIHTMKGHAYTRTCALIVVSCMHEHERGWNWNFTLVFKQRQIKSQVQITLIISVLYYNISVSHPFNTLHFPTLTLYHITSNTHLNP